MTDKNNKTIAIGDIVRLDNSPIKVNNGLYVVIQDGTSGLYLGTDLTMYKVIKNKNGGYSLSKAKYVICFYPLTNTSSKYRYSRKELDTATIEIIESAKPKSYEIIPKGSREIPSGYGFEHPDDDYFYAAISEGDKLIKNFTYLVSQTDKMTAVLSNLALKDGQTLTIKKMNHNWGNHYKKGFSYELRKVDAA